MKKSFFVFILTALCAFPLIAENFSSETLSDERRFFDDIFPNLPPAIRAAAFTDSGHLSYSSWSNVESGSFVVIGRAEGSSIDRQIVNAVLNRNPGYLVETLLVIPRKPEETSLLDVYNALGEISGLKGRLYHSRRRNRYVPLFEDATRLAGNRGTPVPDPPPATSIPANEKIFIRLRDANFGNSFYRAEISQSGNGLIYRMSNSRNLSYLFIPVVREGNLIAQLYFEVIQEGILIYGLSGVDVPDFFASMIDMGSAIGKRLAVIISWVVDGIEKSSK